MSLQETVQVNYTLKAVASDPNGAYNSSTKTWTVNSYNPLQAETESGKRECPLPIHGMPRVTQAFTMISIPESPQKR